MHLPSVVRIGHHYRHPAGFRIDRPRGSGDWLLLDLLTSARVLDCAGERIVPGGSLVLFAPGFPQRYGSIGGEFANHWLHLDQAGPLVAALGLPVNTVWQPVSAQPLAPLFQALDREQRVIGHVSSMVQASMACHLLALVARSRVPVDDPLVEVRNRIRRQLDRAWTVADMARLAGLSPSRLSSRWRVRFGTSPLDDLIAARIERAGWLLAEGRSVAAAGAAVGFADPRYFSRMFRRRTGRRPSEPQRRRR